MQSRRISHRYVPLSVFGGFLLTLLLAPYLCKGAASADTAQPVAPEIITALKGLKTADADARQKTYDLLALKGDARLIPALKAYRDGSLQLQDDKLVIYGERTTVGKDSVLPLIDAVTAQPILGADGKPLYFARPDLSNAIRAPRPLEKKLVNELVASLSLLDPDPTVRTASIRDAAEHAARALPDPADSAKLLESFTKCSTALNDRLARMPNGTEAATLRDAVAAMTAATAEHPKSLLDPAPSDKTVGTVKTSLRKSRDALASVSDKPASDAVAETLSAVSTYQDRLDQHKKALDDLPKINAALKRQLDKDPKGAFTGPLTEAIASNNIIIGDSSAQIAAAKTLGGIGTSRAVNLLNKIVEVAGRTEDKSLFNAATEALHSATRYQTEVHFFQNTFAGLSAGSILILMALGLSIIFGLMGVINMAQGEFMMVGAFTTYVVAEGFKHLGTGAYSYYLLAAIPAAFLVAGLLGYIVEFLVIRHLYGRPLETLLATWGIGLCMIWAVRWKFGDNVSVAPPRWMEGGWEIAPDLVFPLNRLYIILFCAICIAVVYFVVNGTKLGLLLRATTQNREMASALGVPTRRVDGMTFAFGAGLAGLAGVAVPLYNKINPNVGQEYIVDCFMVVVVGGVGKLAGAVWAGLGLGFIGKYLESILGSIPSLASGSSVIGKVLVLALIIAFLQKRPQGLFPPKGRNADA